MLQGARCEPAQAGTADGCLQRCLKLTSQSLGPALPVRGLDRDPAPAPSPSPAPVPVLSHGQESADSVLGPVPDRILHLTTGKGTIRESIKTGISEGITEATGDHIIFEAEIEGFIPGASTTEEDMAITGQTGKTTAKRTARVEGGRALVPPREGLLRPGLEVILGIPISHLLIGRGGLPPPAPPRITAEWSLLSGNLERRRSPLPRITGHLSLQEITKVMSLRSSRFQEQWLKMSRRLRDQNRGRR